MENIEKVFEDCFRLERKIAIYVPSTVDVDKATNNEKQVKRIAEWFSDRFGGATCYNARGNWISSSAGLVTEAVTIVYAFTDADAQNREAAAVRELVENLCIEMRQEAISVEINNKLYFVNKKGAKNNE